MKIVFLATACLICFKGMAADFYPTHYEESRNHFLNLADNFKSISGVKVYNQRVPSKSTEPLFIDALYLPQQSEPKTNLVIVTSGIHGVEAFTGAAIQARFLTKTLKQEWLKNSGFLIVHAVNPYGFKYQRRVDEENVDLNRNVGADEELFHRVSDPYREFETYLNPQQPASTGFWSDTQLFLKSLVKLVTHGKKTITQIAVGGQYQNPEGIYYGGDKVQPNAHLLHYIFSNAGQAYSNILHIDLHTGYGERGRLHFFSHPKAAQLPGFDKIFKNFSIDSGTDQDFYETSGSFERLTLKVFHDKKIVIPMTFEFGTMDSQTIMGGFYSLRNMIYENQGVHQGYKTKTDKVRVKENFMEMFNPSDSKWRAKVLDEGTATLSTVIQRFQELD